VIARTNILEDERSRVARRKVSERYDSGGIRSIGNSRSECASNGWSISPLESRRDPAGFDLDRVTRSRKRKQTARGRVLVRGMGDVERIRGSLQMRAVIERDGRASSGACKSMGTIWHTDETQSMTSTRFCLTRTHRSEVTLAGHDAHFDHEKARPFVEPFPPAPGALKFSSSFLYHPRIRSWEIETRRRDACR